jgi:CheY-like chemotaxis protein
LQKIFIVDDDELHNDLSLMTLQIMGITDVECRTSGRDALAYLAECRQHSRFPDIMFVDLYMPGMSGLSFIKRYESEYMKDNPDCRVIMLSNSILEEEKNEALRYKSISDFWSKPLNKSRLQSLIQNKAEK